MDRREDNNRRKIPRFTSQPINGDLALIKKINFVFQGLFVALTGYFFLRFLMIGPDYIAHFILIGGPSVFCAFRLRDMNKKISLFIENESVTHLERTIHSLSLTWLLYAFLFTLAIVILALINQDFILAPFQ